MLMSTAGLRLEKDYAGDAQQQLNTYLRRDLSSERAIQINKPVTF
jgi:hypothetical protein